MNELPILSILIFLPIVGIFFMTLIRNNNNQSSNNLKHTALWISFLNFLISLYLLFTFNPVSYTHLTLPTTPYV